MSIDTKGGAMPQALDPVTQQHIDRAAAGLADEFEGIFSRETIARYMAESQDLWARRASMSSSRSWPTASPASG